MSETGLLSEQSSALYLNDMNSNRSSKSRSHHSHNGDIEMQVRVIKGLIDTKNMIKDLFMRLGIVIIVSVGIAMLVNGILSYFIYINLPDCNLNEKEAGKYPIIIQPRYNDKNDATPTKKTRSANDDWFWQSQLYDEMRRSNKEVIKKIEDQIDKSIEKLSTVITKSIDDIDHKINSVYLKFGTAHDMELAIPGGRDKRGTVTPTSKPRREKFTTRSRGTFWFRSEGPPGIKSNCTNNTMSGNSEVNSSLSSTPTY